MATSPFPSPTGGGSGAFGLQPQGIHGNDLTQYEQSLSDLLGSSGAGLQAQGAKTVQAPIDYWMSILSGNPTAVTGAAEPDILATKSQYQQARRTVDQYSPMGGGRANAVTQSRFSEASDIGKTLSKERATAATELATTGLAQEGMGIQELTSALQAVLSKMGINVTERGNTMAMIGDLGKGLGSIIGGALAGGGGG